jgi:dihydropyrimidinase
MNEEMPKLIEMGISSVKLYMTYQPMKLGDADVLSIMMSARSLGFTVMVHAENSDIIDLITTHLEAAGHTGPFFHSISRPQIAEDEATYRIISLATLTDVPILIVHMSSSTAVASVREAQTRMLPIHAETCPQYLLLLSDRLQSTPQDAFEGAKCVCSPPLRHDPKDLEAMWRGIANGTFTTFSSDHAPSIYDHPRGKKLGILEDGRMSYKHIPNGLPGVETRLPLLFSFAGQGEDSKLSLPRFVQLTSTNPAKLYGLDGVKGSIAPGYDADLVIWFPSMGKGETVITQEKLHHSVDYTPYEGMRVKNWPRYTILRGKVAWDRDNGGVVGRVGDGRFLKRQLGRIVVGKTGGEVNGMLPGERNFWA